MRILITGGNGYVGREVTRLLLDRHEVCVLDTLRYGPPRFTEDELDKIALVEADVRDAAAMTKVLGQYRPEVVIHLAAIHYIPECEADPSLAVSTNVLGSVNVLMACPPGCRFVYASSGAVYKPDDAPHSEIHAAVEPTDVYGFSKLQGENYVKYLARERNLSAVIVRLFNVIGPGETNPHLMPEIVAQLKAGREMISLGNLWPKRDYIHVKDAARGFVATALGEGVEEGTTVAVNLGTSRPYSVAEVVRKLRRVSGQRFRLTQDKARVRPVDRPILAADNSRIRSLFGWQAMHSIDDALLDLWRNPDLADRLTARYR